VGLKFLSSAFPQQNRNMMAQLLGNILNDKKLASNWREWCCGWKRNHSLERVHKRSLIIFRLFFLKEAFSLLNQVLGLRMSRDS
jgi:hypothetical protein